MCTGRVDLSFVFRAFATGADGVLIGGCWPGECHYITEGNYDALSNMHLAKRLMQHIGLESQRLALEWMSAAEGSRFAEVMSTFVEKLKHLGPIGQAPGASENGLKRNLEAVTRLIPYIKLVERERLRVPTKSVEAYEAFYASSEAERLFHDLIAEKLTLSQILMLLEERPLSMAEIAKRMNLKAAQVSRHIRDSSKQGLVRYDQERKCYALA